MKLTFWETLSLIFAALIGGYLLTTSFGLVLAVLLPLPQAEAVLTAILLSFSFWLCIALWLFYQRKPFQAWLITLGPAMLLFSFYRLML